MLGHKDRDQLELFITGSLRQLVPEDHVLARIDRALDLGWLREEAAKCYCADNGRPGIDPEAAVRLMLAGFLLGIVHDRKLLREAQVNLAIRWFAGYRLHGRLPDHSSLTRPASLSPSSAPTTWRSSPTPRRWPASRAGPDPAGPARGIRYGCAASTTTRPRPRLIR